MLILLFGLVALFVLCAFAVVYPYLVYPFVLGRVPQTDVQKTASRPINASLVFCAFNEGATARDKLSNVQMISKHHGNLEVLAYDDGSSDDTLAVLNSRPDLVTVVAGTGRRGKAHGMKVLAAKATGDILIFTDANVMLAPEAIDNLLEWYRDDSVGGVCGTLRYVNANESATAAVGGAYWRLEERLKDLESRTGNVMGADGSIFSIRRELYPDFPDTVLDDLTVSMSVVFSGKRLIKANDVIAYERLVSARSDEFSRKVRIAARAFHTHLCLRPQLRAMTPLDKYKYISRKLIRWFGGLFLLIAVASAIAIAFILSPWVGLVLTAMITGAAIVAPRLRRGLLAQLSDIVLALIATQLGVLRAARGDTVVTWSPAKSR